jgi:hypothetical protein
MKRLLTITEGHGGGSFSMQYSLDVFLITTTSTPNSLFAFQAT